MKAINAIKGILRKEHDRKRWKNVNWASKPNSGGAVTRLKVPTDDGDIMYATKEGIESQAAEALSKRFRLATHAPILQDERLFADFGYLGNTDATRQVLEGTYDYPEDMDTHTRMLLEEAHHIFKKMSDEEIIDMVSTSDFQYFWQRANENIQSSESNITFSHYKAQSQDEHLSAMQAAKLTLACKTGIPLDRWHNGLTVLLEKEKGNILINKMRAIGLLEVDFN